MTIQSVLASAFDFLYDMENQMNEIYAGLGDASPEEMDKLMAEAGTIQDLLTMHDFYMIDAKVEEVARALGLSELGLDKDVTELSGGQRTKVLLESCFLKNRTSFFLMSLLTILIRSILSGLRDICRTMRTHLY